MTASPLADAGNPAIVAALREAIATHGGRITFADFMAIALYHPEHGYYLAPQRRPGRSGDFLTAPEASAYFGITLARQLAECWERLGQPETWAVREYGSGTGVLAYDLLAGLSDEAPAAAAGLRYHLVEPNPHRLEEAIAGLTEGGFGDRIVADPAGDAPLPPITGVVIANEVADALPVHRLVIREGALLERYVTWRDGAFVDLLDRPTPSAKAAAERLLAEGIALPEGAVFEVSPAASDWFATAARGLARGYTITIDYGYPAAVLYRGHRLEGTLRVYGGHQVGDDPYIAPGERDLTAHVDFTALQRAGEAVGLAMAGFTTQGAMLASLGLGDLLMELQRDPDATMADYVTAQTAILRLIDPGGLGRFGVLIMVRDAASEPPLRAFATPPPPF